MRWRLMAKGVRCEDNHEGADSSMGSNMLGWLFICREEIPMCMVYEAGALNRTERLALMHYVQRLYDTFSYISTIVHLPHIDELLSQPSRHLVW